MNDKEIKNGTNGQTDDQIMVQTAPIEFNSEPSSLLPHKYQLKMMASYFKLEERSTNVAQEIRAGASCFLTMSYILLVNPQVLSAIGIPTTDIVIGTSLSSFVACFIVGIFGNLPFGLAPGIGLSAYLAYGLVLGGGLTATQAFTSCFISGILLCILSVSGGTNLVMKLIPKSIKIGTIVGMGLQIAFVGMTSVNIIVDDLYTLVTLGSLGNYELWLTFMGLVLIASLMHHDVKGAILIGMVVLSLITWWIEDSFPTSWVQWPVIKSELSHLVNLRSFDFNLMGPAVASFLFVGLVDVSGVVIGLSSLAGLSDGTGAVPGSIYAFIGCGVGTIVGAATGSSPVIVYVESAAGIKEGGRTGLAALTTGFLFAASLFLAPIFSQVPTTATAPVAILIGALMMSQASEINWHDVVESIPAFLTLFMIPFTYSITNGILFGLFAAFLLYLTTGQCLQDIKEYFGRKDEFEVLPRSKIAAKTGLSPHASRHSYQTISDER